MKRIIIPAICLAMSLGMVAQNKFTMEQVLNMTQDELMDLSMEDFAEAIKAVGVSNPDELFAMIMNKNVSSASKSDESTFDSPLSTSVITHDEIRRFGCMSIEEAFRLIPGAIVYEKANGVFDVQLRGLSNIPENNFIYNTDNCNTLMMIDGRQVFNYTAGTTFWESLPIGIDDIDRIEIVRGPASALYGANAVTGVINIITFKGNSSQKNVVGNVSYGSQGTSTADVSLRKSLLDNRLFIGASANMQTRERNTDQIYVIPRKGLYMVKDYAAIQNGNGFIYDGKGYDFKTKTAVDNYPNIYEADGVEPNHMSRLQIPYQDLDMMIEKGYLEDMSEGGYVDYHKLNDLRYIEYNAMQSNFMRLTNAQLAQMGIHIPDSLYASYNAMSDYVTAEGLYPDPRMSRKNIGVNGYIHYNPNQNVDINFNLGYQKSSAFSSSYRDDYYAMSDREQETTYIGLNATIYGFNLQANCWGGDQNLCVGFPGYRMEHKQLTAQLDYEFNLLKDVEGQSLKIRPGISLVQYNLNDNENNAYTPKGEKISGYINGECDLSTQAAMLRFDYRLNKMRLIAAYRAEKLNIPDEWTHTWQLGATYSLNENNCLRFVYGRANRSSFAVNSSSNYTYDRTGMPLPDYMTFLANEKSDVMQLDNIEIGYRSRPTPRMLLDIEAFYSASSKYGALVSKLSQYEVSIKDVKAAIQNGVSENSTVNAKTMFDMLKTRSYMQYDNDPCKPKQYGISLGFDWIATDKLIFKLNANWQQTILDNYSEYSQPSAIKHQLVESASKAAAMQSAMGKAMTNDGVSFLQFFIDMAYDIPDPKYYRYSNTGEVIGINIESLAQDGINLASLRSTKKNPYGFEVSEDFTRVTLGSSTAMPEWGKKNNYKSKATPSFYGSLGFIYKPIEQMSIAANCNYMTKREYKIKNPIEGTSLPVNDIFLVNLKLGYQPVKGFEVYFNARNLFDNQKQEFVYGDKIGGIYSLGASFEF